jgi:hypothetical protein
MRHSKLSIDADGWRTLIGRGSMYCDDRVDSFNSGFSYIFGLNANK